MSRRTYTYISSALLAGIALAPCAWTQSRAQPQAADALAHGVQALRGGDPATAVEDFTTVTRLRPLFAEGYLDLGLALEQQGEHKRAIDSLDRARRLKPGLRGASLFLGIAEYQAGDLDKAKRALLRETRLNPKDSKALMWLGITDLDSGHPEEAAVALDSAAAIAPKDVDILYHRGRAHLLISKASYQQMFAIGPDSSRVHEVLGQADAEAERTNDAIGEYKLAIERAPRQTGLHEELGDLYWMAGKLDLADAAYVEELAIDPYNNVTRYKLGSLREIVGNPRDALPLLRQTVAQDPSFENAYYYLGRAQAELGQEEEGIANLKRATTAPGDETLNTLAWYQLSRVYRRIHKAPEAAAALTQFRILRDQKDKRQQEKLASQVDRRKQLPMEQPLPQDSDMESPHDN